MNAHKFFTSVFGTGLIAVAIIALSSTSLNAQDQQSNFPADNPHARVDYETSRLVDPATGEIPADIRAKELKHSRTIPSREDMILQKSSSTAGIQSQQWGFRGPDNVGGRSRALEIDIDNESNILAGGISGGMWRSIDAGASWVRVTPLDEVQSVSCVTQDTRAGHRNVWYYGTGEWLGNSASGGGAAYRGNGMYKSTDGGASWFHLASTAQGMPQDFGVFKYVWRMATDPVREDSSIVYAAVIGGIYRSNDGGETWLPTLVSTARLSLATDIAISSTGVIYATLSSRAVTPSGGGTGTNATRRGIFRSEDGMTWTSITPGNYPTKYERIVLGIAPSDEKTVYFLGETPNAGFQTYDPLGNEEYHSFFKYTYESGDGSGTGGTWENRSNSLPFYIFLGPFSSQGSYDLVLKVKPDDPDFVVIGGTNLYRSSNGFKTSNQNAWIGGYNKEYDPRGANLLAWIDLSYPNHHPDLHDVIFSRNDANVMYTASDGGIHRTSNCTPTNVVWTSLNNGYVTTQFYAIAINHTKSGDKMIMGGMQDNSTFGSLGPGEDWQWLGGGDGGYCALAPDADNTFYISTQFGNIYRTETTDELFVHTLTRANVEGVNRYSFPFIAPWEIDPNAPTTVYLASYSQIYINGVITDKFANVNWTPLPDTRPASGNISAVEISTNPAHKLFIGSNRGSLARLDDANFGFGSPVNIRGSEFPNANISCIASDPENADVIMVVFSNYNVRSLFYTENGGQTWTDVSGNLEEHPDGSGSGPSCRWADVVKVEGKAMWFVGTSTGLYSTTALNGASTVWVQEGKNSIGNAIVSMIRTRQSDGFVAIATHGNGVFATNAVPVSVESNQKLPETFFLEQNYPNPATISTSIRYTVPSSEAFSIKLHDGIGRVLRVIHDGSRNAGIYQTEIMTDDLPAGNYFIRLAGSHGAQTRMLTVTR
jgi:hypothetical protein